MERRGFLLTSVAAGTERIVPKSFGISAPGDCSLNIRAFGATGDGVTDDTVAIQTALNSVSPTGALVCVPPGTYLVSQPLQLRSKTFLLGAGPASLFKRAAVANDIVFASQAVVDVTVQAIAIDINGAAAVPPQTDSYATAISFRNQCSNIRIRDLRLFDGLNKNMCCRHGILVLESKRVWIEDNYLTNGLRIKAGGVCEQLVIAHNIVEDANDNAITAAIATAPSSTTDILIRANIVKSAAVAYIYVGDDGAATAGLTYQSIVLDGNLLEGAANSTMLLVRLANVTERLHIVNNVVASTGVPASFSAGISVTPQTAFASSGTDFLIAHNTVTGRFNLAGIWIKSVNRARINDNQISDCNPGDGIRLSGVSEGTVEANCIFNCGRGIWFLDEASSLQVIGNFISRASAQGILFAARPGVPLGSVSAHFIGNRISGSGGPAIQEDPAVSLDSHYLFNDLRANAGGPMVNVRAAATRLGNLGTDDYILRHISTTKTWNPVSLSNRGFDSTTVVVKGARVGDTVAVGFSRPVPPGATLTGAVTANDTVTVTLLNMTGATFNLGSGSVRADVWRH